MTNLLQTLTPLPLILASGHQDRQTVLKEITRVIAANFVDMASRHKAGTLPGYEDISLDLSQLGCLIRASLQNAITEHNDSVPKSESGRKWKQIDTIPAYAVAEALDELFDIKNICMMNFIGEDYKEFADPRYCPLGMYVSDPTDPKVGTYTLDDSYIVRAAMEIEPTLSTKAINELKMLLSVFAPIVCTNRDPYLIAVKNGIFNDKTKKLMDFSPEFVFLTKCPVAFVENAPLPVIDDDRCEGGTWDVESWMSDLNDNPQVVDTLWDILAAAIRPNRAWNKAPFLYATRGCNGKGTYCTLLQNLVGANAVCSMNLEQMNNPSYLEGIVGASLIYGDENDVGRYIDGSSNFKSLVTGDTVAVNRKYEKVVRMGFSGLIVQNCNEKPRMRDRTDSLARRILLVPFDKNFLGAENKDIKGDYLRRPEVLEYVLSRVLMRQIDELVGCNATDELMDEFRLENSSVRQFMDEFENEFVWNTVPSGFAYDLYVSWNSRVNGGKSTSTLSRLNFKRELAELLTAEGFEGQWVWKPGVCNMTRATLDGMKDPEPLIREYQLDEWHGSIPGADGCCSPEFKKSYRDVLQRK